VLLLGFLGSAPVLLFRRLRERDDDDLAVALALIVTGALAAAVDWTFQLPAVFAPVVLGTAVLCCGGAGASAIAPARRRAFGRLGIVALAWVAAGSGVVILLTEQALSASHSADRRGDLQAAVTDARRAAGIEPFSPEPQIQLALVQLQAGNLDAAKEAADEATRLAPGDWRTWLVSLKVAGKREDRSGAVRSVAELERTLPVPLSQLTSAG
jgi:Flp pilus assembly protein TadD